MFTQRRLSINQRDNHCQIAALSLSHPANCIATTATAAAAAADVGSGIPGDHSPVPFQWRNKERGTKWGGGTVAGAAGEGVQNILTKIFYD